MSAAAATVTYVVIFGYWGQLISLWNCFMAVLGKNKINKNFGFYLLLFFIKKKLM